MKVFEFRQRTPEWFEAKRGVVSASEVGQWIFKQPDGLIRTEQNARKHLIYRKLAEISAPDEMPVPYSSPSMDRGSYLEDLARDAYEKRTGNNVEQVGFVLMENGRIGCSPDGFIDGRRANVQFKCPIASTHIKYLHEKKLPGEHAAQVHFEMAVCGTEFNDFFSFCPKLPGFLVRVHRDKMTEAVEKSIQGVLRAFYDVSGSIAEAWEEEFQSTDKNQPKGNNAKQAANA